MPQIAKYFELLQEINISNLKLKYLKDEPKQIKDYQDELSAHEELKRQLQELETELQKTDESADLIRIGYVKILNGTIKAFERIQHYNIYYPDLNQGMVISGYLFGLILNDLKSTLTTEGHYYPIPRFYMSEKAWDAYAFYELLQSLKEKLVSDLFKTKMNGIEFYEEIKTSINNFLNLLREKGQI
jgi:hypothetical protein